MTDQPLQGRTALVTGASRGIGRAISLRLSRAGAAVAITGTATQCLNETGELIAANGGECLTLVADVAEPGAAERVVTQVKSQLGIVDILVNNAGLFGVEGPFIDNDTNDWWRVLEVNLRGPMLYTQAVLADMVAEKAGFILNIGSDAAIQASPMNSSYAVSKAGLLRLTDSLAVSLEGTGVVVFALSPGLVETDMTRGIPRLKAIPKLHWRSIDLIGDLVLKVLDERLAEFSGCYFHVNDDIDAIIAARDTVLAQGLYRLGLSRLVPGEN